MSAARSRAIGRGRAEVAELEARVAVLDRALEAEPSSARIHFILGGALEGLGRDADAVSAYERATELRDGYAKPHHRLSVLYAKLGNPELAQEARRWYNRFMVAKGSGSP